MKLLYCQDCGDIIAPFRQKNKPRYCACTRHALWWEDPQKGIVRVYDKYGDDGQPIEAKAWLIGMTNLWLQYPSETLTKEDYEAIIDAHDDYYLFKRQRSVAIRFRPGMTGDSGWAQLPKDK